MGEPQLLRFWVYLVPLIPSIICSVFLLYQLLSRRASRQAIHYHVIILMNAFGLLYEVTNIMWFMHFYLTGYILSATPAFCRIWVFVDSCVYVIIGMLMGWASVERHILIFHQGWVATRLGRILLHYLPLMFCWLYPTIFYGTIYFVLPCDVSFRYDSVVCGYYACISRNPSLAFWDSILNFVVQAVVIVVFSLALFVRVIYRRCQIHRRVEWRNHWKMASQLLSISVIYFVFLIPPMSLNTAYTLGLPWNSGLDFFRLSMYLVYFTVLLTPFVCVQQVPEVWAKAKKLVSCRSRRLVAPFSATIGHSNRTPVATLTAANA